MLEIEPNFILMLWMFLVMYFFIGIGNIIIGITKWGKLKKVEKYGAGDVLIGILFMFIFFMVILM